MTGRRAPEVDGTIRVLLDVRQERHAQDRKWGPLSENMHPDADPRVSVRMVPNHFSLDESTAKALCQDRAEQGKVTFSDILVEEVAEALREAANVARMQVGADPTYEDIVRFENRLRVELVQVAAVAVKWAEAIDARRA